MIVVTGATGSIGRALLDKLGDRAVAVVRRQEQGAELGGRYVVGDFNRPETIGKALSAGDRLFLNSSIWPGFVQRHCEVIDLAAKEGVAQVVTVSVRGAKPGEPLGGGMHGEVEAHLVASGLPYAILRPVGFMQNLIREVREGDIYGAYGQAKVGYIDTRDIAEVAAVLLTRPVGESDVYELTGPNTQTHAEIAAAITAAIGRQVRYVDLPVPEEAEHLVRLGIPEPYATQRAGLMKDLGDNRWADTTPTVETVTGRKPRSLADFLSDHAAAFDQ